MSTLGQLTATRIGQTGPTGDEFTYVDISSIDNHAKRIVRPKRLPVDAAPSRARQCLRTGDVLVSMTRPNLNAVAIVPPDLNGAIGSTGFHVLRPNKDVDPHWLYYAVQSRNFVQSMSELVQGALYPAVRPKDIRAYELLAPSLDIQRRIVSEIEKQFSRLDEAVANLQRVKANLKRYKASVLKAAVEGRLVPTEAELAIREGRRYEASERLTQRLLEARRANWSGRGRYVEPNFSLPKDLPFLPDGWTWAPFGLMGKDPFNTVQTGPFGAQLHNTDFTAAGVPVIAVGNLTGTGFRRDGLYYIDRDKANQLARYDVWSGDILFARSGATLGKVCVAPNDVADWRMTGHILRARLNTEFLLPDVAVYSLAALPAVTRQIFGNVRGVTRPGFNTSLLESIWIPIPPLVEQQRMVAEVDRYLSIVLGIEKEVDANLKRAQVLKQAVLRRALSGELIDRSSVIEPLSPLILIPGTLTEASSARAALSAEIVRQLHADATFGQVKHQKIFHLCEHIAQLRSVQVRYRRAGFGPLNMQVINDNERVMEQSCWYAQKQRQGSSGHHYVHLSKAGGHAPYLAAYFSEEQRHTIRRLIDLMRGWKTDRCEMFSTVYAAWNDLLILGREATPDAILHEVLDLWDEKKKRFSRQEWLDQIAWIGKNGFVPTGFGQLTRATTDGVTADLFSDPSR